MRRPECEAVSEDLVAYADGELGPAARRLVEAHLAACLTCGRELEQLAEVGAVLRAFPRVEPSADFGDRMQRRLELEAVPGRATGRRWWRAAQWGLPALAAAAAIVVMLRSAVGPPDGAPTATGAPDRPPVLAAPPPAPEAPRVAEAPTAEAKAAEEVASAGTSDLSPELAPEDLPPELVEHPEFFLRLPVVRRLDKLEHFEEVRQRNGADPLGHVGNGVTG